MQLPAWNDAETRRVPAEAAAPAVAVPVKWVRLLVGLQLLLLAAGAAAALVVRDRLAEVSSNSVAATESQEQRFDEVAAGTKALETELFALRQQIASQTGEDVIFLKTLIMKPQIDPLLARKTARAVRRYSELYRRDPDLVMAIIAVESDFNPNAVSHVGATGLMQVMPHWKKVLGITGDLRDPDVSINYGLQILGFYEEMYKDLKMALTAYNRGPGPVDTALMRGVDPKNDYAGRVMAQYERLKKLNVQVTPE
jgi:soluble lytic murein transglycosylase-like protein